MFHSFIQGSCTYINDLWIFLDLHQSHLNCFKRGYNLTTVVWKYPKLNSLSVCCCFPHTWDILLQVSIRVRLIRSNTMSGFFSLNSPQGQLQGNLYTVVGGWVNVLWNLPVTLLTILCTVGLLFLRYLTYSKVTFALHSLPCWDCFSRLSLSGHPPSTKTNISSFLLDQQCCRPRICCTWHRSPFSLCSKHFLVVLEQRTRNDSQRPHEKWG